MISFSEVVAKYGISKTTLQRLVKSGKLKAERVLIPNTARVERRCLESDIQDYLKKRQEGVEQ